ncbi:unnamed protein product [Polarella glacialis]|uniref:Uncharacterized protein n=1 Tax=Polarella glacialis TaxID=89957 RepID=A0A813DS28_POLGL|nr:unnamed protein product [Polarella glacialis]
MGSGQRVGDGFLVENALSVFIIKMRCAGYNPFLRKLPSLDHKLAECQKRSICRIGHATADQLPANELAEFDYLQEPAGSRCSLQGACVAEARLHLLRGSLGPPLEAVGWLSSLTMSYHLHAYDGEGNMVWATSVNAFPDGDVDVRPPTLAQFGVQEELDKLMTEGTEQNCYLFQVAQACYP